MLSRINKHTRDSRVFFNEKDHTYFLTDLQKNADVSVTKLIYNFVPKFDAQQVLKKMSHTKRFENYNGMTDDQIKTAWKSSGSTASNLGTQMHKMIENFYNENLRDVPASIEYLQFLNFEKERDKRGWQIYRTEWSIFDADKSLAGQLDALFKDKDGNFIIVDWKRVKDIKTCNKFEKCNGPISHLENCNYNLYSLQLNLYSAILESLYGICVAEKYICAMHPELEDYRLYPALELNVESKNILDTIL